MSDNPYAQYPAERRRDEFGLEEPPRVSILAVLSLILAVVCCIPGLGVLAVLFGGLALAGIGKSRGRVTGKALAGVGVALGILATVGWLAISIGLAQAWSMYKTQIVGGSAPMVQAVSDGDVQAVRTHLRESASADVADEEIALFSAMIQREFGDFVEAPTGFSEMLESFAAAYGQSGVRGGGGGSQQNPAIPIALQFDNGRTVIHIVIQNDSFATSLLRVDDFFIVMKNRKALTLRRDGPAASSAVSMGFDPFHVSELSAAERPALPAPPQAPSPAPAPEPE